MKPVVLATDRKPFGCCPGTQRRVWAGYYPTPTNETGEAEPAWLAAAESLRGHPAGGGPLCVWYAGTGRMGAATVGVSSG
jgi:hypothetical protein